MILLQSLIFNKIIKFSTVINSFRYNSNIRKSFNLNSGVKTRIFVSRGEIKDANRS